MNDNSSLLIMSVYAPSTYNPYWYELQKKFIKRTTLVPYDFKIIVNNVDAKLFDEEDIIRINKENIGHPAAINQIFSFMKREKLYTRYLLLDSDCFPVRAGWHNILDKQMTEFNKTIAAPIRYENLDMFPHPCVVYMNDKGLNNIGLSFDYAMVDNLLGDKIDEVGGLMVKITKYILPLLRTNRVNLHPVAGAIYHHLFYHHGAGSRGFDFRLLKKYEYYNHWIDNKNQEKFGDDLMVALISDPNSYIDKLMYGY